MVANDVPYDRLMTFWGDQHLLDNNIKQVPARSPTGVGEFIGDDEDSCGSDGEWVDEGMTFHEDGILWEVTSVVDGVIKCVVLSPPDKVHLGEKIYRNKRTVGALVKCSNDL